MSPYIYRISLKFIIPSCSPIITSFINNFQNMFLALALLGDMGGIGGIVVSLIGIIVFPIAAHSYTLKALKKLYKAGTKDPNIFLPERHK